MEIQKRCDTVKEGCMNKFKMETYVLAIIHNIMIVTILLRA